MNTDTETSPQPAGLRGYRVLSRRDVGLVMLFFLLFECVALWSWYRNEHARLERGFMHDSEALYQQVSQRFDQNEAALNSLAALFSTFDGLNYRDINTFTGTLLNSTRISLPLTSCNGWTTPGDRPSNVTWPKAPAPP